MSPATRRRLAILIGLIVAVGNRPAHADKPVSTADLAVDQVSIKAGPKLLGAILGREADGALAFAVRREWLKKAQPKFFESTLRDEMAETRSALAELHRRIDDWRKERSPEGAFEFFLKKEAERVEKELRALDGGTRDEGAPFMVVDVAPAKVDRIAGQLPQRRAIAQAAWRTGFADVESRSAASLAQELKKRNVAAVDDPDELLDLLPPRRENDAAWAARKAIVEYQHRKPLDFQGTGGLLLKAGEKLQAANAARLIQELIQSLAGGSLQDLLDPPAGKPARTAPGGLVDHKWLATAFKAAAAEDVSGFRVTRVEQNIAASRVEVETRFVARLPDGTWRTVWQHVEKADASKPREDAEQQILQDPQVRAALDLVKSLGGGGEEQVKLAVRFGAATMEAQKSADSRFYQFRDRCLSRLDGPVLRVPPTK